MAPTVLLLAFSSDLSTSLGERGRLPNGDFDFVLRYTRSIWDFSQFFAITINFAGPIRDSCTTSGTGGFDGQGQSVSQVCDGYTYTAVQAIDIAFDIMVGCMGHLALATFAYRLFVDALQSMMQRGQIGYDIFEAVHFQGGSLSSVPALLKHAIGSTPVPRTAQAKWTLFTMGLASLYVVSFPTLVFAMSGYTSYFVPCMTQSVTHWDSTLQSSTNATTTNIEDCGSSLAPVWGQFLADVHEHSLEKKFAEGQLVDHGE